MDITVNIDQSQFNQVTMALAAKLKNTQPMLEEIGVLVERSVKRNFREGGRPKWKPSGERKKDRAARLKRAQKGLPSRGQKTLVDTGNLQQSITHQVQGREVAVGTNVLYAPIHHFGGTIKAKGKSLHFATPDGWVQTKSVNIPARPFLMLQQEDYRRIDKIMKKHIRSANV